MNPFKTLSVLLIAPLLTSAVYAASRAGDVVYSPTMKEAGVIVRLHDDGTAQVVNLNETIESRELAAGLVAQQPSAEFTAAQEVAFLHDNHIVCRAQTSTHERAQVFATFANGLATVVNTHSFGGCGLGQFRAKIYVTLPLAALSLPVEKSGEFAKGTKVRVVEQGWLKRNPSGREPLGLCAVGKKGRVVRVYANGLVQIGGCWADTRDLIVTH